MANTEHLAEPLVLRTLGKKGYLKYPRAFSEMYDFDRSSIPNPSAFVTRKNGKVQLIFEWESEQLVKKGE